MEKDGRRIVGAAEQSYRRVDNDVRKAVALGALEVLERLAIETQPVLL